MHSDNKFLEHEKKLIVICITVMGLCIFWLLFVENLIIPYLNLDNKHLKIANIAFKNNDVRQKHLQSWVWQNSISGQNINDGDSLFVGNKSKAVVQFTNKNQFIINENSLVSFNNQTGESVLKLLGGKFNFVVNGELKIQIGDEVLTIKGNDTKIEINTTVMGNNQADVKVFKGQIDIQNNRTKKSVRLKTKDVAKLETKKTKNKDIKNTYDETVEDMQIAQMSRVDPKPETPELSTDTFSLSENIPTLAKINNETTTAILPERPPLIPVLEPTTADINYFWKLDDIYDINQLPLKPAQAKPFVVHQKIALKWHSDDKSQNQIQMQNQVQNQMQNQMQSYGELKCGEHPFELKFDQSDFQYEVPSACLGINFWRISFDKIHWSDSTSFVVSASYRDDLNLEINSFPKPIALLKDNVQTNLTFKTNQPALGFIVQSSTSIDFTDTQPQLQWIAQNSLAINFVKTGSYYYRVRVIDKLRQISDWSKVIMIQVYKPIPIKRIELAKTAIKKQNINFQPYVLETPQPIVQNRPSLLEPERLPSNELVTKYTEAPLQIGFPNDNYDASHLSIQPTAWAMQSTTQLYNKKPWSLATGMALNSIYWKNNIGLEGTIKTKLAGIGESGTASALQQQELRIHKRWVTEFPFGFSRELKFSFFGGVENYKNSSFYFASKYSLLKMGTLIDFPFRSRWSSGGEFEYGLANDKSNKKEISGHLNYFYNKKLSIGIGYRLHLFEAMSQASSADNLLPYREGYTEGYSVMNYYF